LMEEYDVPREGGPIGVMLSEHTHGRHIIQKLNTLSEIYGNGNKNVKRDIASAMREYIYLLREHIDKENIVLFPMAEVHIPEDAMENLYNNFVHFEENEMGQDTHKRMLNILKTLQTQYKGH